MGKFEQMGENENEYKNVKKSLNKVYYSQYY